MGIRMPEICWAVFKWQVINLRSCCIWLVDSVESMMMHGLANPKLTLYSLVELYRRFRGTYCSHLLSWRWEQRDPLKHRYILPDYTASVPELNNILVYSCFQARKENCEKRLQASSCPSGRIFMKFDIWEFFKNMRRKIQYSLKSCKNNGYFSEDVCTLMVKSCWNLLKIRNISGKTCTENRNIFCVQQLFSENSAVYKTMWKSMVDSSWNVMAHGDARERKWRGNWRMEWVASTLHTTSEHGVIQHYYRWCAHLGCQ